MAAGTVKCWACFLSYKTHHRNKRVQKPLHPQASPCTVRKNLCLRMYTETTPNPLALKFVLGADVTLQGTHLFSSAKEAAHVRVLHEILSLPGIVSVVAAPQFLSVTKTDQVAWPLLESIILSILHHHWGDFPLDFQGKDAPMAASSPSAYEPSNAPDMADATPEDHQMFEDVCGLIDDMVRPAVEADGGVVQVVAVGDGVVYVSLAGACFLQCRVIGGGRINCYGQNS